MNKKIKWAIPFAVLALSCGIAAGCSVKHTHSYTKWDQGNETQHWKVCPDDGAIDESSKANHNFVDGSCECGKTQPVKDVTITNGTTDTNGTVTLSKTTGKTGDSVTVTVAPNEGYQLKSLTINGANVFGAMTGNTYEFTVADDTTVIAVFEKIASSSVNAVITGKKYGVTGNSLTAGTPVTLSATGRDDIVTKIKEGGDNLVIKVDEIAGDNWSVKVDGYIAAAIIIPRDAEYTSAIALEYDLMENLKATWGNSDSVDLSKQNEGKITHTSGYVQWVSSKKSYESVAITATVGNGGYRQGVFIRFKGDNYDADKYVMVSKENNDKIGWCAMDGGSDYKGSPISPWDDKIKPLTKKDYELTLVRDGADIYFFVDGEYIDKKTFNGYADKECYVGLFCTNATTMKNSERTFKIAQASDFIEVSVTNETATDAHGTVTIDKQTAKLNEQVTVTLAPETGYKIKDLKIDGVSVFSQMTGTSYTFTALKDTTVVAEFEESKLVNSLELTVNAANGFTAEGAKITLQQLGEKRTAVVGTNGTAILGSKEKPVALGTHNVYADFGGYQIKLGTVNVEASDSDESQGKPVSVTLGFTGKKEGPAPVSANHATGELTFKLGKDGGGAYNDIYDIATIEGNGFFATKLKFNNIGDGQRSVSIILKVQMLDGSTKEIKYVVQNKKEHFGADGQFYLCLDDDSMGSNGVFDKKGEATQVNINAYADALKDGGLWIVLGYDAQTGGLVAYAGEDLGAVRLIKTYGNIATDLKVVGMGVGNWFGIGGNSDTASVTLKYGKTMAEIGVAEDTKYNVNTSLAEGCAEMGSVSVDATEGKYYQGTQCTVTVTAEAGYKLTSLQIGENTIEQGWTQDGLTYTYTFNVTANTDVVATLEKSATVNVTFKFNGANIPADGTVIELTSQKDGSVKTHAVGNTAIGLEAEVQYELSIYGYAVVIITVPANNGEISVTLEKVAAIADKVVDHVTITADTITLTNSSGNGAFDGWQTTDNPAAKLILSDEQMSAEKLVLQFTLKGKNAQKSYNGVFGIGMTGYKGVRLMFCTADNAMEDGKLTLADLNSLQLSQNDVSGHNYEATYGFIETLAASENGVVIRALRDGTNLRFYAQNSDGQWILFHSTTCAADAKNEICFVGNGATYTVSNLSVTVNEATAPEQGGTVTPTTPVEG